VTDQIARPNDRLEVRNAVGETLDVWEVLEVRSSEVLYRSLKTGLKVTVPTESLTRKFKAPTEKEEITLQPVAKQLFSIRDDGDGKYSICNVPILACESRGMKLYDEEYLDRLVATFWQDRETVLQSYPGSEAHPFEPTVIVGHTADKKADGLDKNQQRESIGTISAMWRDGEHLYCDISGLSGEWTQRLRGGALPHRSCEVKVKSCRIVSLALLSEEPFFHMPAMTRFSESTSDEGVEVFRFSLEGVNFMDPQFLSQLLDVFKNGASLVESAMQNQAGGSAPVTGGPPVQTPASSTTGQMGGGTTPQRSQTQQFADGGSPVTAAVESKNPSGGEGTDKPKIGTDKAAVSTDSEGRPAETASSQAAPPGKKPKMGADIKLDAEASPEEFRKQAYEAIRVLQEYSQQLAAQNDEMRQEITKQSGTLKFAADAITGLEQDKKRITIHTRLVTMAKSGTPLGGVEAMQKWEERLCKLSAEEAEETFGMLEDIPKMSLGQRVKLSTDADSGFAEELRKYGAVWENDREHLSAQGYTKDGFAASMALGDLLPGGDEEGEA